MELAHIRSLLIGLLVFWLLLNLAFLPPRTLGVSAEWTDGEYRFEGGTSPADLMFAILLFGAYGLLINTAPPESDIPLSGVVRRFVAFWLDLMFAIAAVAPVLGIAPTIIEWRRTGAFQWAFSRTSYAKGDSLQVSLLLVVMAFALVLYHAVPLMRKCPSPGSCIMGYQIVPDAGTALTLRNAIFRSLLGFIGIAAWCITIFVGRDRRRGKIWVDKMFSTRAMRVG